MGLFSRKDWNILAIIFERSDLFQINGQRVKGAAAEKARDGAKRHPRSLFWAVFDQKGAYLEGGPGAGSNNVPADTVKRLERELRYNSAIQEVLKTLSSGSEDKVARPMPGAAPSKRPE
ncbi:MAG: hypothetical protein DWQ34_05065 [Planctomycetota bacterium]|nr:MAG: hypothetical protein DWQ29_02845 [Planctomycetota bacterium]REJ95943.1 MAG: hypothetical protein DWQ34_05065 [Planctomycetota bacterium]REK29238.1 MAG: hypothetical protein DWQ41_04615 [Planctomycetota bacterium]REK29422.1 MAG: hypothetical protein DWQ45_22905 [Planctomycetota bacterium]